jgi:3-dehydroquinate synthetase
VRRLLERAGLPVRGPALGAARMLELMALDKKVAAGRVRFIMLEAIGKAVLREVPDAGLVEQAITAAAQ